MNVLKNPPPLAPPATYDIIGLTEADLEALYLVCGSIVGTGLIRQTTDGMYHRIQTALGLNGGMNFYRLRATRVTGHLAVS